MTVRVAPLNPKHAAETLFDAHKDERAWRDSFAEYLDRKRAGHALSRTHEVWGLGQADSARLFGVSRQALDGVSFLDLFAQGRTRELLAACRDMFAFETAHV